MPVVIDTKNVLLITMSCGGGMGGSRWEELVIDEGNKIPSNQLHTFTDALTGVEFQLNTANAVKITPKQMLRVYYDITDFKNYGGKKNCTKAYREGVLVLDRNEKWTCNPVYSTERNKHYWLSEEQIVK